MCNQTPYREAGYKPRDKDELWDESAMNPKNKKKKPHTGEEFLRDTVR